LFAGRKLLVADDSPYYRTVIGLTFTDEGMEVTTAEDGRQALEIIELSAPDVVLASVSMPTISGYELCRQIKQSERFAHIPVMLLAGLHEDLDHAEAFRVGADDVVTKPFKSIRQLVGRVGSLLGGKPAEADGSGGYAHSTLGLAGAEPAEADPVAADEHEVQISAPEANEADVSDEHNMSDVKVFVEAPLMTEHEPVEPEPEPAGSTCAADVELQTADTQQLQRIYVEPESAAPIGYAQDDTKELPPPESKPAAPGVAPVVQPTESFEAPVAATSAIDTSRIGTHEMNEQSTPTAPLPAPAVFNDGLLDLDDFDRPAQAAREDLILDLDFEDPTPVAAIPEIAVEVIPEAAPAFAAPSPVESVAADPVPSHEAQHVGDLHEWSIVVDEPAASAPVPAETAPVIEAAAPQPTETEMALSPAMIDAIARRAVELMSEKVVREIAWDVVPELAELLIKQKLEE
jgi:CheY-like chemotaxis protein